MAETLLPAGQIGVFLTLSPLAKTRRDGRIEQRQIQMNWYNGTVSILDLVGLYQQDPTENSSEPLVIISPSDYNGTYQTKVQFGFPVDRNTSLVPSCLGYWIAYFRNETIIASNCLKIQPTWMWDNRETLGSIQLNQLFLPGTHNSGSYRQYRGHSSDTIFNRYLICQEEDIWTQLVYGIRYLDIRVGYYPDLADKFWLNHNYIRINPISVLIDALKWFLEATNEIVILDFHRFPVGFNTNQASETHAELVRMLEQELGSFMVPSDERSNPTLDTLWSMNKTLIVAYSDDQTRISHPLLWPYIPQEWGDKRTVDDLFPFLWDMNRKRVGFRYFWAAMAELTPSSMDVILRPKGGLRKLAAASNLNVTAWYRDLWWSTSNIVAVDFFLSTDIIDVAVTANLKRAQCRDEEARNSKRSANFRDVSESAYAPNLSLFQRFRHRIQTSARKLKTHILQMLPRL